MREVLVKDRESGSRIRMILPEGHFLQSASFGPFGWSASTRSAGGVVHSFHNGKLQKISIPLKGITISPYGEKAVSEKWWAGASAAVVISTCGYWMPAKA